MKIKRYKKAERYMSLYKNNFGFREPFQVLVDGTFCQVALDHKVNIQDQLPKYLHGQCKLLTTKCVIEETKRLGKAVRGAFLIVSQFGTHDCSHEKPISASKCLSSFIIDTKNKDHYLVATQDHQLRLKIAKSSVCPLLKLANNALVMEKPTPQVAGKVRRTHHYLANKLKDDERSNLEKLKTEENINENPEEIVMKKKKKGPKGPNPLSCKKAKKTSKVKKPQDSTATGPNHHESSVTTKTQKRRRHKKANKQPETTTQPPPLVAQSS